MDDLKLIVASNIIKLRTDAAMTQAELGERLNYSDKTISKWERGEAIPGAQTLKQMAELFGTTVDYLLDSHDQWHSAREIEEEESRVFEYSGTAIMLASAMAIFTGATLVFVILWLIGHLFWSIFAFSIPVIFVTMLVLNSILNRGRHNYYIVSALVLSLIVMVYAILGKYRPWQLFLIAIPAEMLVFLCFRIRKRQKKH